MNESVATVRTCLTVHGQMTDEERRAFERHCQSLDTRLRSFVAEDVRIDLHIKDRGTKGQHLTLDAHIAGLPHLAATAEHTDFAHALNLVRDDMIRLVGDAKETHRPSNTKHFRSA